MSKTLAEVSWEGDERGRSLLGGLVAQQRSGVAIVGARAADHTGLKWAKSISEHAARHGDIVISGGARGVDEAAHKAALTAGGDSLAILGCGLHKLQSRHHELSQCGVGLLSPFSSMQAARRWTFPQRNEWIAALADRVIVVQASLKSGALQTARHALKAQKTVWVVTHLPDHHLHLGCLSLLSEGARVYSPPEIWSGAQPDHSDRLIDRPAHPSALWQASQRDPLPLDTLAELAGISLSEALATATLLELDGWLSRTPDDQFMRGYGR